jgi:hypothetical protein
MNVPSPEWATIFCKTHHLPGPTLRAAFEPRICLPGEVEAVFERMARKSAAGRRSVR